MHYRYINYSPQTYKSEVQPIDPIILNHIKKIRHELNMTVRDLAEKCELSHSTISDLENGHNLPNQLTIIQISHALNKKACDVFIFDPSALDSYYGRNTDHG